MVKRYGYTWQYNFTTGGGEDADGNPIAGIKIWKGFECDVQTSSGNFVAGTNGDKIAVSYSIFTKDYRAAEIGDVLKDTNLKEHTVLQVHNYGGKYEIWV